MQPPTLSVENEYVWRQRLALYRAGNPSPCETKRYLSSYRTVLVYFSPISSQSLVTSRSPGLALLGSVLETSSLLKLLAFVERFCDDPTSTLAVAILFLDRIVDATSSYRPAPQPLVAPTLPAATTYLETQKLQLPPLPVPFTSKATDETESGPASSLASTSKQRRVLKTKPARAKKKAATKKGKSEQQRAFGRDITNVVASAAASEQQQLLPQRTIAATATAIPAPFLSTTASKENGSKTLALTPTSAASEEAKKAVVISNTRSSRVEQMKAAIHRKLRDKHTAPHIVATTLLLASK